MKKVKMLKKLVEEIENCKHRPRDAYYSGYNRGLDSAISVIENKITSIQLKDSKF